MIPELEREALEIESILQGLSHYTKIDDKDGWRGTFITIRGMSIISGDSWLNPRSEKKFEDTVIRGIMEYVEENFSARACYSTYHSYSPYGTYSQYQQEITLYVSDFCAYGRLKGESGYHTLFRRNRRMEIFVEILPAIAAPTTVQGTEVYPITLYGAAIPYISQSPSGACSIHRPTGIKACASEATTFLFNCEVALMLLQSRLFAHHLGDNHRKPRYAYSWDTQQLTDHLRGEVYPFSLGQGFGGAVIKSLEDSSNF